MELHKKYTLLVVAASLLIGSVVRANMKSNIPDFPSTS